MCVGFAQKQLLVQKAVTTVGRLPKMAAHVVLVQNQRERAAAMRGKALVFSALLLATDICATSAQSLFEQRAKCQRYADDFIKKNSGGTNEYWMETYKSNYDTKLGNCYLLIKWISLSKSQNNYIQNMLFDAVTQEGLATIWESTTTNTKTGEINDPYFLGVKNTFEAAEKYILDKMKTER